MKAAHIQEIKAKQSLYNTYAQAYKLCLKASFFSGLKTGWSNSPQTLNLAFIAVFTAVSQLKNTKVVLSGSQEMHISLFEKWEWPILEKNFQRIMQQKDYKTVEKLFLCITCCLEQLFKYASLVMYFRKFKYCN